MYNKIVHNREFYYGKNSIKIIVSIGTCDKFDNYSFILFVRGKYLPKIRKHNFKNLRDFCSFGSCVLYCTGINWYKLK